jgi:hypothetical protein
MKDVNVNDLLNELVNYEFEHLLLAGHYPGRVSVAVKIYPENLGCIIPCLFIYENNGEKRFFTNLKEAVEAYVGI